MISKSLSTSERRAALHRVSGRLAEFAQGLYVLLVVHADDFGLLQGDLFTVQHVIDPSSPRKAADFLSALKALHDVGLICWYEVDGKPFIEIAGFERHQIGLHKRTKSIFPGNSGKFPELPDQRTERRERNGTNGRRTAAAPRLSQQAVQNVGDVNVELITAVVQKELLPLGVSDGDLPDATKQRCAAYGIAYDSASVRKAIDSARVRVHLPMAKAGMP
jgi:hypothetical protein